MLATVCASTMSARITQRRAAGSAFNARVTSGGVPGGLRRREGRPPCHADRGLVGLEDHDRDAVLKEAELLELLGLLERRGWQAMERRERRARVGVEADVLEAGDAAGIAVVGDRVLREVERVAVGGADD